MIEHSQKRTIGTKVEDYTDHQKVCAERVRVQQQDLAYIESQLE